MNPLIRNVIDGFEVAAAALKYAQKNLSALPEEVNGSLEELGQMGTAVLNLNAALESLGGTLSLDTAG